MGCYDCVCERKEWDCSNNFCQLSKLNTFNDYEDEGWDCYRGDCSFYSPDRKDFIDYILKVNKHKGDDFDFSSLEVKSFENDFQESLCIKRFWGGDYCEDFTYGTWSEVYPKKDLYIYNLWNLLQRQEFWEGDKDTFEEIKNEKIKCIKFYGGNIIQLELYNYDLWYEIEITDQDSEKFELLEMLFFRHDDMDIKDILLYME